MKRLSLIFCLVLLAATHAFSQIKYPIISQTIITPPYPMSLEDFYADGGNKLTVQLIVKDVTLADYPVKFRLVLSGRGITITTSPSFLPAPFSLNGGETYSLSGADLAAYFNPNNLDFSGYSKTQYQRTGRLPDGVYQLKFEVIYYNRNISVASTTPALIFLSQNEPPLLNFPAKQEIISALTPQNIMFNWTLMHSPFSTPTFAPEYKFDLWEIWPDDLDPYVVVNTTEPIYSNTVKSTSLMYTVNEPLLLTGRRYVWRVRVIDPEGNARFTNDGYSEARWFRFGKICPVPVISLDKVGVAGISVKWDGDYHQNRYEVRYREKKRKDAQWYTKNTTQLSATIDNLKAVTDYEVQVCGFCDDQPSDYSDLLSVATKAETKFECGVAPVNPDLANSKPLDKLMPKDNIKAGDFVVQVTQSSGGGGTFSGKGNVLVPYLKYLKVEVEFKNIKVNDDYRLTDGVIYTVYNLNNSMVLRTANPSFLIPDPTKPVENNDFTKIADSKTNTDTTVSHIEFQSDVAKITYDNGKTVEVRASNDGLVAVTNDKDKDETQYVADTKTKTLYSGKPETLGSNANTTNATPQPKSSGTIYNVTFSRHNLQSYGFDAPDATNPAGNYESVTLDGKPYLVPWKSVEAGHADRVKAKITGGPTDSIHFRRESEALVMTAPGTADTVQVLLSGQVDMEEDNVYAWYPEYTKVNDSVNSQNRVLAGQLNMVSYQKQRITVYLVPVNGCVYPQNLTDVQNYLNRIYSQALIEWDVKEVKGFEVSINGSNARKIDNVVKDDNMDYSADMKVVNEAFKNNAKYDKNDYYLFFFDDATNQNIAGYMPFNQQFGYIFKYNQQLDVYLRTIAHELGHGPFRLYHTFSDKNKYVQTQGSTNNLMDYVDKSKAQTAINLQKYQWDEIHSWHLGANWLEGENEAEAVTLEIEKNRGIEINYDKDEDRTYITPSGKPITLPPSIKVLEFITSCPKLNIPQGALVAFKVGEDKIFCANYLKGKFIGYVNKGNPKEIYPDKKIEYKIGDKVFIGLPSTINCQLEISIGDLIVNFNETDKERKGNISPSLPITNLKLYNSFKDPSICFTGIAKEYYEAGKDATGEYKDALLRIATLIQKTGDGLFKDYETAFANNPAYLDRLEQQSLWGTLLQDYLAFENALKAFNDNRADLEQQILATDDPSRVIKLSFMLTYDYHKSIKYKTRLHILQVISNKTIIGGWAERIVNRVLSDVPVEDLPTLISDLKQNNLLKKLYYGIDGDNFDAFIANLQKITNDYYGGEEKVKEYGKTLNADRLIIYGRSSFSDYGATHEFNSDGTLKLSTWRNDISFSFANGNHTVNITKIDNVPIASDPFTLVGFTLLENGKKPQVYIMPLVCATGKITRQKTAEVKTAITTIVTVGSFFIGAGEIMTATTAFKIVVASFDLGMNAADVILNMEQVQNKIKGLDGGATFLSVWEKVNFAYNIATLPSAVMSSTEVASDFAKAWKELRAKNAIKAEEELTADVCKRLDGLTEEIEKGIAKITDDFLDIGKQIDNLPVPPKGYSFYKRADGKKWIRRIDASDPNTPRLTVKNGEIARFSGTTDINQTVEFVYHVKSDKFVQNVIDDIEPAFFGADNRFGQGFYVASEGETALAEVMHHGGNPAASKVIRFTMDKSQLKILDLTDETIAKNWKYQEAREFELAHIGESKDIYYRLFQKLAQNAKEAGYNAIKFNSFRNPGGVNYVILETVNKEFYKQVLKPQMVMPGEE